MHREFRASSFGKALFGVNRRKLLSPVLMIVILVLAMCSTAAAKQATSAFSLSATSINFGNYAVGTTGGPDSLTVTNSGNAILRITSIILTGANASNFAQTNTCGSSMAAGAHCTLSITFTPSACGLRTASLSIKANSIASAKTVSLAGTGIAAAASVSPSSLTFAGQAVGATSAARSVTLKNTGTAALNITSLALTGTNPSDFAQTNNCGTSVAAGANCSISITFTPAASGSRTASLSITNNASGSPQTVSLSGTGTAPAASVSPSSLTFAGQAVGTTSAAQSVTLNNTGTAALNISSLALTGTNPSDFAQSNNCGTSLAAGASCTISVTFMPAASGSWTASLSITDNASSSPQTVSLGGTGTASAVSLSPSSLAFGNEAVQMASSPQTVTMTNTGSAALSITSLAFAGADAGDFVQTDTCGSSVAAGANCTIAVLFTPSATGARTAALTISDNASGSPQTASLSGTGTHDVILSWTSSQTSGVMGYNVYRGTTSRGESSTPLNSTPIDGTTYADESVTAAATYYYVVMSVASNGVTQSAASNEAAATVPSP